ncbi:MAG: aminodeoxychorismate/anthranilate synthase component II [Planctomycetes bacterium]|nr:aminodeoxychorismate/anthranilate synthase component II [Planctomycetota bacterium]
MILLIDNYDSFAFNLYQSLAGMGAQVHVVRNDAHSVEALLEQAPTAIVLSPGPGRPKDAGVCLDLLAALPKGLPVLGVCLGHQSLVEHYGGDLEVDEGPVHGKASLVHHDGQGLFRGLPSPFPCGRYHSLRAVRATLPDCLELRAWTEAGDVMAVQHTGEAHFGLQFHPESILTPQGDQLLAQFLLLSGEPATAR